MTTPLPRFLSLTSLRVLLALAERGSTVAAADAVHLTQSAVSKQLAKLEEAIGQPLFVRHPSGLRPTPAGAIYVRQARVAVKAMEDAALEVARLFVGNNVLRLQTLPIFGDRWLLPRFSRFAEHNPDIDVQFTSLQMEGQAEPDAAFRYGSPPFAGYAWSYVNGRDVLLVGAPAYLGRLRQDSNDVGWLGAATVLEHPGTPNRWSDLVALGNLPAATPEPRRIVQLGFYSLVIRAAIAGQGLALIPRDLVVSELDAGLLETVADIGFASPNAYWFTRPLDRPSRPTLDAFETWLLAEAK